MVNSDTRPRPTTGGALSERFFVLESDFSANRDDVRA
jgi:hypothetical protein